MTWETRVLSGADTVSICVRELQITYFPVTSLIYISIDSLTDRLLKVNAQHAIAPDDLRIRITLS